MSFMEGWMGKKTASAQPEAGAEMSGFIAAIKAEAKAALASYASEKNMLPATVRRLEEVIDEAPPAALRVGDRMGMADAMASAILDAVSDDGSNEAVLARAFPERLIQIASK